MIKPWLGCLLSAAIVSACVLTTSAWAQPASALSTSTVSVPFPEFSTLLKLNEKEVSKAPVDFVFSPAVVAVTADRKLATITADVTLMLLNEKWISVPIGPAAGVLKVTLDGTPAPVYTQAGTLFAIVDGAKKKSLALQVVREEPVALVAADSTVKLPLIPAPLAQVTMTIAAGNQDVDTIGGSAVTVSTDVGKTTLSGTFSGDTPATVTWRHQAPPGVVVAARVMASTLTRVAVDRGLLSYQVEVDYQITRAGVSEFKLALPEGVEFDKATGTDVQSAEMTGEGKERVVTVKLNTAVRGAYKIQLSYEKSFEEKENPGVALVTPLDVAGSRGFVGLEVRGGYDLNPTVTSAERVDVKELPACIWDAADSPLLFGYRYEKPGATLTARISLGLVKHDEVAVLMAMCDTCEAATTVTADGRNITKLMYVMRNNLKQSLVVRLPANAQLWSAFVDDQPVTPSKNAAGDILVPLKKSAAVDPDDDQSYKAKRDERRRGNTLRQGHDYLRQQRDTAVTDLKPYDVEIVFVTPADRLADKGDLSLALPQVDVPVGNMAWAVLLPESLRVVDTTGTIAETAHFGLPFEHFAEAGRIQDGQKLIEQARASLSVAKSDQEQLANHSKAAGVLPVRIEMPLTGELYRFEKLLVVDEPITLTMTYRKKVN